METDREKKKSHAHFAGKKALQHIIEARIKGQFAQEETHGAELPGALFASCDSARETAIIITILSVIIQVFLLPHIPVFGVFLVGFLIFKTTRSALLGWARLERVHRLIEEERWEIEHHREQEQEELIEMYQAKGFSGKLLDDVIQTLMADDNRLLQIMLQEELGLKLESFEHPLKQAFGAFLGVVCASILILAGYFIVPFSGIYIGSALTIIIASFLNAKGERNRVFPSIIWHLGSALLAALATFFLSEIILTAFRS